MHARFEPLEHGAHARAVLWAPRPTLGRERSVHNPMAMRRLREDWPKPLARAEGGIGPRHPLIGAALMRELPEQECESIDIHAVLKVDESAAQAEAATAAATAVATIAALGRVRERFLYPLRCQIPQCAPHYRTWTHVVHFKARQTKVGELAHRVGHVKKSILCLDVAVQDAVRVEEAQPARQLHGEANLLVDQVWACRWHRQRARVRVRG